jgi:hypothetical protein
MRANEARNEREAHAQIAESCLTARHAERLREVEDEIQITPFNALVAIVFILVVAIGCKFFEGAL